MEVTEEERLDEILLVLYVAEWNNPNPLTIDSFNNLVKEVLETEEERLVRTTLDKLIIDGYVEYAFGRAGVYLTDEGKRFILSNEGYTEKLEKRVEEAIIRKETLKQLNRGKWSFWISIVAILISIASFLFSVFGKH
jgi:hypothetical protein